MNNSNWITFSFTEELINISKKKKNIVVLDADLSDDINLKKFLGNFPKRFIQNGIAEQDMVSMAGGMALSGLLPVVNSFASFLTARANEQIYNNATENTKIIYLCLYAGLFPAGAGKSHQSMRDISVLSSLPNIEIFHPSDHIQVKQILNYCIKKSKKNCAIRLSIGAPPSNILNLKNNNFKYGQGNVISDGSEIVIFTYGQHMISECLKLKNFLREKGLNLKVINMPNVNSFSLNWIKKIIKKIDFICILEDHMRDGGMGDLLTSFLAEHNLLNKRKIKNFSFDAFPKCGTHQEVLNYHKIDFKNLAQKILKFKKFK